MNMFDKNIDFNLYKTFYIVTQCKSFSKASENLFVSQPAISYNIKELEKALDVKLFYRNAKGVTLTPEGENLYYYIKNACDYICLGEQSIKESKEMISGNIRIGVPTHIGISYLGDKIERFHKKYPNIKFYIQNRSTTDMIYMLEKHQLDFIIDCFPICKNNLELVTKKLISLETAFVGEFDFVNRFCNKEIKKENINDIPLILPNEGTSTREKINGVFEKYNIKLNPVMEISTTEMTLKMIRRNIGIGWLIENTVSEKIEKNRMKKVNVDLELPKIDIGIAYIKKFVTYASERFIKEELTELKK